MYTFATQITEPVVGPDPKHRECSCAGLVVALPEGTLHLFAETPEELEALGWGILAEVERLKKARPAAHAHAETPA